MMKFQTKAIICIILILTMPGLDLIPEYFKFLIIPYGVFVMGFTINTVLSMEYKKVKL